MEALETKKKRLEFLLELRDRGLETAPGQITRTERTIAFMELAILLRNRKAERDAKIDKVLESK
jgi:hypothetical protein